MDQGNKAAFGPSDKEKKYDRQLRLWAASGQAALESAHLLLVNSGSGTVGIETLKNLVLPGIGQFTIADDAVVNDADLGVNFFLDEESLGKSRAQACTDFLLELNPEVKGNSFSGSENGSALSEALSHGHNYTAILYALPLAPEAVEQLQAYSRERLIPLIAIHCVGYYAYFQIGLPGPFPIVDTHPEQTATEDLRLLSPWPELSEFASSMTADIDNLDAHKHGHIPLVVILLHYIELWKQQHDGHPPTKYSDKIAFRKAIIDAMRKDNAEGGEENFEEAAAAVMKHVVVPELPPSLREIFEFDHSKDTLNRNFWIISDAIKAFYQANQRLPVSGGLPDMKAESNIYIQLQNIYKSKARQDAAEILQAVQSVPGGDNITKEEVDLFCANARFAKLINSNTNAIQLDQEAGRQLANDEIAAVAGPEMPLSLLPIYLALTATSHQTTASAAEIQEFVVRKAAAYKDNERAMKIAEEVSRSAGGELHNISAAVGGMVAQELIKVITQQYIALDNTCIYDGIETVKSFILKRQEPEVSTAGMTVTIAAFGGRAPDFLECVNIHSSNKARWKTGNLYLGLKLPPTMDHALSCNNLKCRKELRTSALVTTCSHIYCIDCAQRRGLTTSDSQKRSACPACGTQLSHPEDAVVTNLKPSEEYKTSVLSGFSPSMIMECAGRALSFWAYQTTQDNYYQQHLYKTLSEKYSNMNLQNSQKIKEAELVVEKLNRQIASLESEHGVLRQKNDEFAQAYKEKSQRLLQTQDLYDRLKRVAEMGNIQRAATDAVTHALSTGSANQLRRQGHISSPDRNNFVTSNTRGYTYNNRLMEPHRNSLLSDNRVVSAPWPWQDSRAPASNIRPPIAASPIAFQSEFKENASYTNFGSDRRPLGNLGIAGGVKMSSPSVIHDAVAKGHP